MRNGGDTRLIDLNALQTLLDLLRGDGYTVIGPTVRDGVIVQDEIHSVDELPAGWTDRQEPGTYRLERRDDPALFANVLGPHAPRRHLHPSRLKLFEARRGADGKVVLDDEDRQVPRYAFLGLRACEIAAIEVQDRVFLSPDHVDADYAARRASAFIIGVDCAAPAGNCFCTSMEGDPGVERGHDLALTEFVAALEHGFLVRAGSAAGRAMLERLSSAPADAEHLERRQDQLHASRAAIRKTLKTEGLATALRENPLHPRWQAIAERCLGCANCTLVCPTCFCASVEEVGALSAAGETAHVERWRRDDSCFTLDFTHLHGGSVRVSTASRYRQWLTHKLGTWEQQFGSSGCVGCGRCITWCPVGIDLTVEAAAIAACPNTETAPQARQEHSA